MMKENKAATSVFKKWRMTRFLVFGQGWLKINVASVTWESEWFKNYFLYDSLTRTRFDFGWISDGDGDFFGDGRLLLFFVFSVTLFLTDSGALKTMLLSLGFFSFWLFFSNSLSPKSPSPKVQTPITEVAPGYNKG